MRILGGIKRGSWEDKGSILGGYREDNGRIRIMGRNKVRVRVKVTIMVRVRVRVTGLR